MGQSCPRVIPSLPLLNLYLHGRSQLNIKLNSNACRKLTYKKISLIQIISPLDIVVNNNNINFILRSAGSINSEL
jgi:hypothetical protein